jgi:hypothetical protein
VYYLSYPESPRDLQDVAAAVFVAVQMQRCMGTSQQKAIVIRGSAWQVKAADWLIGLLDRPPGTQPAGAAPPEYRLPDEDRNAESGLLLRVTPLAHLDTPLAMLEVARAIGVLAVTLQPIPIWEQGVLVLRGNDDRLALAARLLQEFEGPAGEGTKEIGAGGASDETVVVTYVDEATPQSLTETAAAIRTGMKLQSVVAFTTRKAIAMRGTEDQLVEARQMVLAGLGK